MGEGRDGDAWEVRVGRERGEWRKKRKLGEGRQEKNVRKNAADEKGSGVEGHRREDTEDQGGQSGKGRRKTGGSMKKKTGRGKWEVLTGGKEVEGGRGNKGQSKGIREVSRWELSG